MVLGVLLSLSGAWLDATTFNYLLGFKQKTHILYEPDMTNINTYYCKPTIAINAWFTVKLSSFNTLSAELENIISKLQYQADSTIDTAAIILQQTTMFTISYTKMISATVQLTSKAVSDPYFKGVN